jgi:hypothetical protein
MTPFFTFALALVIPGALVILLAALLLMNRLSGSLTIAAGALAYLVQITWVRTFQCPTCGHRMERRER